MEYKFTQDKENYEMYASGGVFYAGQTAFPVRLATEIFRRCMALRNESRRCVLYDPCCGGAYHLATLAYFNWSRIERIIASDIDANILSIAAKNLSLLKPDGLERRIEEIKSMYQQYGKPSHETALQYALALRQQQDKPIETQVFRANALDSAAIRAGLDDTKPDIVISDLPYGQHSEWQGISTVEPVHQLLDSLLSVLTSNAVVAIAAAKKDKIKHEGYHRLEKFNVGKRQIVILRPDK